MLHNENDVTSSSLNNDNSLSEDFAHFSLSVNEEKIPIAKDIYLTICSNPFTQL